MDGIIVNTKTITAAQYTGTNLTIGARCTGANGSSFGNYFQGQLNDVRIYDHCLSDKEVEEIAKGLVLHYKLDNNGRGNPNLIPNTSPNEVQYTYPSGNTYNDKFAATTSIVPSASQYILSFDAKSTVAGDKVRAHYYNPNTTTRCETNQGIITTASDGNIDFTLSTQWEHYWVIYTQSSTTAVKRIIFPRMFGPDRTEAAKGSGVVSVKNLKFEEGTVSTIWQPNSNDSLYTSFNFNNTIYDSSGYNNNGTIIGEIELNNDSPRYAVATYINSPDPTTNSATGEYYISSNCALTTPSTLTITWWANPENGYGGNISHAMWSTTANDISSDYQVSAFNHRDTGFDVNSSDGVHLRLSTSSFIKNEWHHYTVTYDGQTTKLYKDGVQQTSVAFTAAKTLGSFTKILIGHSRAGGVHRKMKGKYSDFRVYATALTADQVLELYHTSATIDNKGNAYSRELVEK